MTVEHWTDDMLDKLAESINANTIAIRENAEATKENGNYIKQLRDESKELSIRFTAYQQASQWVVNLAFGLLATATLTSIISAVFRR